MSFARVGKADVNERKYPFIVEVPAAADGLNVELNRQIVGFTSCTTPHCDLDVLHSETSKFITAGAFSIWRRRAPLPNSLAERFTKQPALDLRHFSRRRPGGSRRTSPSCRSYCGARELLRRLDLRAVSIFKDWAAVIAKSHPERIVVVK